MDKKEIEVTNIIFKQMIEKGINLPQKTKSNYINELKNVYEKYKKILKENSIILKDININININEIDNICNELIKDFNKKNYSKDFSKIMEYLYTNHFLGIYKKNLSIKESKTFYDYLILYRVRSVEKKFNKVSRSEIFHRPYDLFDDVGRYGRIKVPCLYLATSIELCINEIHENIDFGLVGSFKINRTNKRTIEILELAIKPGDFLDASKIISQADRIKEGYKCRNFDEFKLNSGVARKTYLYWFPLIAACSFARNDEMVKGNKINDEYKISNELMEWIINKNRGYDSDRLIGLRYFSCALDDKGECTPSELGFNYVLPATERIDNNKYCNKLCESVFVNEPKIIDFTNIKEREIIKEKQLNYINESKDRYDHLNLTNTLASSKHNLID